MFSLSSISHTTDDKSSAHVVKSLDMIHHYQSCLLVKNKKPVKLMAKKAQVYKSFWSSAYSTHVTKCSIQNNLACTCLYLGVWHESVMSKIITVSTHLPIIWPKVSFKQLSLSNGLLTVPFHGWIFCSFHSTMLHK